MLNLMAALPTLAKTDNLAGFVVLKSVHGLLFAVSASVSAAMGVQLCENQKFYGAFVLNRRVDLHAIEATPARRRGGVDSSPLDGASTAASSSRNDLVKNYRARDSLVDFHTD